MPPPALLIVPSRWRTIDGEGTMRRAVMCIRIVVVLTISAILGCPSPALTLTQILPDAKVEADQQSLTEIIGTFDRAEEAIRARDLNGMMELYAENYQYHGLKRDDVRNIWADLFSQYDLISNIHTFSAIKVLQSGKEATAEITCTGAVWANSRDTKQRIPIDSWHQEVHHLVKSKDGWRIVGNLGGEQTIRRFGTAPHPLF
ncbi:MAG TPA: nuclear transport factor 2 family protein [Nitrospira sp.]|nr:nuclear transport factor 2 family protein [Nitrospira sp.]